MAGMPMRVKAWPGLFFNIYGRMVSCRVSRRDSHSGPAGQLGRDEDDAGGRRNAWEPRRRFKARELVLDLWSRAGISTQGPRVSRR